MPTATTAEGSLYHHGFARIAAAVPTVRIADPAYNANQTIELARAAHEQGAAVVAFPELGLTSYTAEDLFHQDALLDATLDGIETIRQASTELQPLIIVGAPLRADDAIFNAAVVIHRGEVLGAVPKSYIPEYREYYEKRQFRAARDVITPVVRLRHGDAPLATDQLFVASDVPGLVVHVEICEDLWTPLPPSTYAAMAGATVLVNLSASNVTVAKADYRRLLCASQSARTISAYLYTAAGDGESTTDLAWDGQAMIYENGEALATGTRFATTPELIIADVDLDRLRTDRAAMSSFADAAHDHRTHLVSFRRIPFSGEPRTTQLDREIPRFPYVPADPSTRAARCEEVYRIQVAGLRTRLAATGIEKIVIGVSGGLDSTHALIVAARTLDSLDLPRTHVLAYTMPGFGTSERTLQNARDLMAALGVTAAEVDIRPPAQEMLARIGHPAAAGTPDYDVTYENVQAGERTSTLFRLANLHNAIVLGTGDLSELALGWSTYGVGDQMSHYAINASVPKTLIQFLLRWAIDSGQVGDAAQSTIADILDTEISPELIPAGDGAIQSSESTVGPYDLQDFFLYHVLRFGNRPSKVAYLARHAWGDASHGRWPDLIPADRRHAYGPEEIDRWLAVFLDRFFRTSQFKRSAIPNAPKVGSGGSLSPRGDWRAPSDGNATVWLDELRGSEG